MKDCIIFYNAPELPKNRFFAESIKTALEKRSISAEISTNKRPEYIPRLAVNRTRDAELATLLEQGGCRVFNRSETCFLGNDKQAAYEFFHSAGIPMLQSRFFKKGELPLSDIYPCVAKPSHGHGGALVELAKNNGELLAACEKIFAAGDTAVVQPCASTVGVDLRCYVLGGELIAAVRRTSQNDFRANFTLGGDCCAVTPSAQELDIVKDVCRLTAPDFIGVDIIYDGGRPILNEIEDAVGCRMLYALKLCSPAEMLADYIVRKC